MPLDLSVVLNLRTSVIAAIITQITYLVRTSHANDPTLAIWPISLCTQIIQCLSIVTTCIVYLRPFLDSLQTGFIQVDDLRRKRLPGFGYSPEQSAAREGRRISKLWSKWSRTPSETQRSGDFELQRNANTRSQVLGSRAHAGVGSRHERGNEREDVQSRGGIVMTTTLTVREEDRNNGGEAVSGAE